MKRSLVVLSLVSLVFAGVASAEVKKGDVMLDFLAGWTQQNFSDEAGGEDISAFFGAVRPGIALTDNIRVAGVGAVAKISNGTDTTIWALGVSGEYVFMPANTWNPYVGAMFAWASADTDIGLFDGEGGDSSVDGWLLAPRVGLLYTLNRANNLFGEFQYQFWGGDIGDALDNGYMLLFGIEHKFRVGQ
jgi:opacity protein-like surface antigen